MPRRAYGAEVHGLSESAGTRANPLGQMPEELSVRDAEDGKHAVGVVAEHGEAAAVDSFNGACGRGRLSGRRAVNGGAGVGADGACDEVG